MRRDLSRLAHDTYDLLVVGGGIAGLATAYDAAQRGLSVALVERDDFGAATSFNHLKTVHGGLRYLQRAQLGRMRRSILERRTFARIAPHLVRPLGFVTPLGSAFSPRGPLAFRAAFEVDAWLGRDRNHDLPAGLHLPPGTFLEAPEAQRRVGHAVRLPGARSALWHDYQVINAERLTLSFALAADACGAVLANHLEANRLVRKGSQVEGVGVTDRDSGETFEVRARLVVNAAGPWSDAFTPSAHGPSRLLALNLVTDRPAGDVALAMPGPDGRALILVPWNGRTVIGTWESPDARRPGTAVEPSDVRRFLADIERAFPGLGLTQDEVTLVHRGVVPARSRGARLTLESRDHLLDHARIDGVQGLLTMVGTKFTTARLLAERVVDHAVARLDVPAAACRTHEEPLPGAPAGPGLLSASGPSGRLSGAVGGLPDAALSRLSRVYGGRADEIVALAAADPSLAEPLVPGSPVVGAEVRHAVRYEMARTLPDLVVRRTSLGSAGPADAETVTACARAMGRELGWEGTRIDRELADLHQFYAPVPLTA